MPEAQVPAPQPNPQPQVATAAPNQHNWKKVGLTVLVILVVSGLIVAAYWFLVLNKSSEDSDLTGPVPKVTTKQATESAKEATSSAEKDETADWKNYKSGNFSFSYPQGWSVVKESNGDITLNSPDFDSNTPSQSEPAVVIKKGTTIKFSSPKSYSSGNDLAKYLKDNGYSSYFSSGVGVLTETTLDDESGLKYDTKLGVYTASENYTSTSYFVVHDGKIYVVTRSYISGKKTEYDKTWNEILDTFKFL